MPFQTRGAAPRGWVLRFEQGATLRAAPVHARGVTYSIGWWGSRVGPALGSAGPETHRPCRGTRRDTLHIDNSTTPHQLVEWMGSATDERDGRILLGLLSREGVTDTDEPRKSSWTLPRVS